MPYVVKAVGRNIVGGRLEKQDNRKSISMGNYEVLMGGRTRSILLDMNLQWELFCKSYWDQITDPKLSYLLPRVICQIFSIPPVDNMDTVMSVLVIMYNATEPQLVNGFIRLNNIRGTLTLGVNILIKKLNTHFEQLFLEYNEVRNTIIKEKYLQDAPGDGMSANVLIHDPKILKLTEKLQTDLETHFEAKKKDTLEGALTFPFSLMVNILQTLKFSKARENLYKSIVEKIKKINIPEYKDKVKKIPRKTPPVLNGPELAKWYVEELLRVFTKLKDAIMAREKYITKNALALYKALTAMKDI